MSCSEWVSLSFSEGTGLQLGGSSGFTAGPGHPASHSGAIKDRIWKDGRSHGESKLGPLPLVSKIVVEC